MRFRPQLQAFRRAEDHGRWHGVAAPQPHAVELELAPPDLTCNHGADHQLLPIPSPSYLHQHRICCDEEHWGKPASTDRSAGPMAHGQEAMKTDETEPLGIVMPQSGQIVL